jgi:hypothetical protein
MIGAVGFGSILLVALSAVDPPSAGPPGALPSPPTADATWYGAPAAVADGVSVALMATAWGTKQEGLLVLGGAGYILAGPIVHLANGRGERALGSLGLRLLAAGIAAGAVFMDFYVNRGCDPDAGPPCGAPIIGLVAGGAALLGAAILDDLRARAPIAPPTARTSLTPSLVVTPQLGLVGVAGRF